jgi:hypothetical protein
MSGPFAVLMPAAEEAARRRNLRAARRFNIK